MEGEYQVKCKKCRREIPDGCVYCPLCGVKQSRSQNTKSRGNGQGSVYQLPNKTWICVRTVGYTTADGRLLRQKRSKSGFKTKKDALAYLPKLEAAPKPKVTTFAQLYDMWLPTHRAGKDTMNCYRAAYKWYAPVHNVPLSELTVDDLQDCIDECERGRRTRENMKALAGLMYKYGIPRRLTDINLGQYLIVSGESSEKKMFALSLRKIFKLGFERVGFVIEKFADKYEAGKFSGGFLSAQFESGKTDIIPPFYWEKSTEKSIAGLRKYCRKYGLDAIFSYSTDISEVLQAAADIKARIFHYDERFADGHTPRISNQKDVGKEAVKMLSDLLYNRSQESDRRRMLQVALVPKWGNR